MSLLPFSLYNTFGNDKTLEMDKNEIVDIQMKYQREIEKLEEENRELRKRLLICNKGHKKNKDNNIKLPLIDLYSEILDDLNDCQQSENHMPKIVVVGDQSSGKTSVLEMIAQSRIFPRGSGEMMTRSPVKVTLSESPYHVAQFKDSEKEFDLGKEKDLIALRKEIELRMKKGIKNGKTISNDIVSLTVKGPGLPRMILIDLPGIISTVTNDMSPDTKDNITQLVKSYMVNPNSIIMCIQDGSIDAERSNVTDLVSCIDPNGERTIFVLTKIDMAEKNSFNPDRLKKILEGKLFPMKALGYFAVITGSGKVNESIEEIKKYEEEYFLNSKLFKAGAFKPNQMTTANMSIAVSNCFWNMVKETIEQQSDEFRAMRFNLETEWKNSFPKSRELDREELFEKARNTILDEISRVNGITPKQWEDFIMHSLWKDVKDDVIQNIYLPIFISSKIRDIQIVNTSIDIMLKKWADTILPHKSADCAWKSLVLFVQNFLDKDNLNHDEYLFKDLKKSVLNNAINIHEWDKKSFDMLRLLQINALEDILIDNKSQWDTGVKFMESAIQETIDDIKIKLKDYQGKTWFEKWVNWSNNNTTKYSRYFTIIQEEVDQILKSSVTNKAKLNEDMMLDKVKYNLSNRGIDFGDDKNIDEKYISTVANYLFKKHFLQESLQNAKECKKAFYYYQQQSLSKNIDNNKLTVFHCDDVVLFWRIYKMLQSTTHFLRQQITNTEAKRFIKEIKDVLVEYGENKEQLESLFVGRQVTLAEELKKIRSIQEKMDIFIQTLNKEKN
ncbi:unnamed protein product [Gordionus sp. m RMFG-2023]|uniref:dynamin-like 120 kDa protein, mitochondrial n=1 Tax=Gordionus sp. m RMFG-2023 TaxID=3053472 RepID=UPI0030DE83A6